MDSPLCAANKKPRAHEETVGDGEETLKAERGSVFLIVTFCTVCSVKRFWFCFFFSRDAQGERASHFQR